MKDYALLYDKAVVNHQITTDKDIYKVCELDLKKRKKSKFKKYPYYFDLKNANRYVKLAKVLSPHKLALFQLAFISQINGWKMKSNHGRYYSEALYTCARKNAKSFEASLILCSELLISELENKMNQQLYIVATNLKQSLLTLQQSKDLIKRLQKSSDLARNFKITRTRIYSTVTGSRIEALPARPGVLNGLKPSIVDIDEVEAMKDNKIIQVMKSGMALEKNGLTLLTSTAGFNLNSPVRTEWKTVESALKNNDLNSRLLGFIYTQDSREEIFKDPSTWVKSSPLLSVPKVADVMRPYLKQQLKTASIQNTVASTVTKNFNRFETANDSAFIDPDKWTTNEIKPIDLHDRSNVIIGCDLSRSRDLTSVSILVQLKDKKYYTDTVSFVPTGDKGTISDKSKADGIDYLSLEQKGFCHVYRHGYGYVPDDAVPNYVEKLINKYHFKAPVTVAFDRWGANQLIQKLSNDQRINLVPVRQNPSTLSEPIEWLYKSIASHRMLHRSNPLFDYGFHNIEMIRTFTGLPYFNKHRNVEKIDNVFSLLDCCKIQQQLEDNRDKNTVLAKELDNNDFTF